MAKKDQASASLSTASYEVLKPLRHDGDPYAPGDTVTLTDDQAAELRALGVVGQPKPVASDPVPAASAPAGK